jgi:hypothetical protein
MLYVIWLVVHLIVCVSPTYQTGFVLSAAPLAVESSSGVIKAPASPPLQRLNARNSNDKKEDFIVTKSFKDVRMWNIRLDDWEKATTEDYRGQPCQSRKIARLHQDLGLRREGLLVRFPYQDTARTTNR